MTRTDILNLLIESCSYTRYLEIGVGDPTHNFVHVNCPVKVGVDPSGAGTCSMTSDEFFAQSQDIFDVIFIDGLHLAEQVIRDVENSLEHLSLQGTIILHDCCPEREVNQLRTIEDPSWTGDVWKAFAHFRKTRSDLFMLTVATDWGIGIIQRGEQELFREEGELDWNFFCRFKEKLLNLKSPDKFIAWVREREGLPK